MISIPRRLEKISDFVISDAIVDVGSDHGLLPKFLLEKGKIKKAVITDISVKCVDKARKNLQDNLSFASFVCCDGLNFDITKTILFHDNLPLKSLKTVPVDVVIAGMGGKEIKKILSHKESKKYTRFILQPQKNTVELRLFLINNGFNIVSDIVVKDLKMFYNILVVVRSNQICKLSDAELQFGKTNLQNPTQDFIDYLHFRKMKCEEILGKKQVPQIYKEWEQIKKILTGVM